ncbi:M23 family metallopeptidase [Streptomyces rimosus]|uniref:M23 family metallopeptidase n=1 Tax=Streptomyces rimosus TaxID=1927 RepID=UPI0004C98F9D|nr:M23 family metallopeptidase [Streptomyces rimosus]
MNDRHSPESPAPAVPSPDASYAHYPAYESYGHQDTQAGQAAYGVGAPHFGAFPGHQATGAHDVSPYDTTTYGTDTYATAAYATGAYGGGYDAGTHPAGVYGPGTANSGPHATGTQPEAAYDPYSHTAYDGGYGSGPATAPDAYEATAVWGAVESDLIAGIPAQAGPPQPGHPYGDAASSQWETMTWAGPGLGSYGNEPHENGQAYGSGPYASTNDQYGSAYGTYEAPPGMEAAEDRFADEHGHGIGAPDTDPHAGPHGAPHADPFSSTAIAEALTQTTPAITSGLDGPDGFDSLAPGAPGASGTTGTTDDPYAADITPDGGPAPVGVPVGRGSRSRRAAQGSGSSGRGRRRTAKRSALLTVAVPSVAAMGVCAVAAASVTSGAENGAKDGMTTQAAGDPAAVQPAVANNKLDTQLASLSAGADDFADRASRTQERIDLKARQAAEKKRKAEEAARKEAMRPKFVLPVTQRGLSATYGQAGVNWMSLHTGIDFPVDYGTPVMAATDGTVRTQFNSAYGNMAIVTAPDGTETWYCHLSTATVRSGKVKAGDQIAYSGKSGNSTGPHLHFEVRPGGGSAVDPLPWLRSHGLNPT